MARHFFATSPRVNDVQSGGEAYWPGQFPVSEADRTRHFRASSLRVVGVLAMLVLIFGGLVGLALSTIAK